MLLATEENINIFNTQLIAYFNYLHSIVDNIKIKNKVTKYINKIKLGIQIDNSMIINLFYKNLYNHKNKINNHEEEVIKIFQIHLFEDKLDLINIWKTLTDENKNTIWKYLKIFVLLCEQK